MRQMGDMRLGADGDLDFSDGDLVIGEATAQHQKLLLYSEKGEWKEESTVGVGAFSYLDGDELQDLPRAINVEFTRDGMTVQSVKLLPNGEIETDADYA